MGILNGSRDPEQSPKSRVKISADPSGSAYRKLLHFISIVGNRGCETETKL